MARAWGTFTHLRPLPLPVPTAEVVNRLSCIPTQLAWAPRIEYITAHRDPWPLPRDANPAVAEAYGLDAANFAQILGAFPVFARKHRDFFAYLKERLERWRVEA